METAKSIAAWLVCALSFLGGAHANSVVQESNAAEVAARHRNQVLTQGFLRTDGWDLAGGQLLPEFDTEELRAAAASELASILRADLVGERLPQVEALPASAASADYPVLLREALLGELRRFQRSEPIEATQLSGSQIVHSGEVDGAVEMIIAVPSPDSAREPADVEALFGRWRKTDHSGQFESAALLFEVGDAAERSKSLEWLAAALESQTSSAAVAPLRGAIGPCPASEPWPLSDPFTQGLESVLESGGGLAVLSYFPGHPGGVRSAAASFRSMGLRALADQYERSIPSPLLPLPSGHQRRQATELSALRQRRVLGRPTPMFSAVLSHGGALSLRPGPGRGPDAAQGSSTYRPSANLARAVDVFGADSGSFGTAGAAMELARLLTIWEAPAMAWSCLSASIEAADQISPADVLFIRVLQDALGSPPLSADTKEVLAKKLSADALDPLLFLNSTLR